VTKAFELKTIDPAGAVHWLHGGKRGNKRKGGKRVRGKEWRRGGQGGNAMKE